MTVDLPAGELPILFGNVSIPARTQVRGGYLSRPDQRGSFPGVVVVPSARGLNAAVRALCRTFARYGLATLAVDIYRGEGPKSGADEGTRLAAIGGVSDRRATADLGDALGFLQAPQTSWSHPDRIGLLGLGLGGRFAALAAGRDDVTGGLALCYAPLGAGDPPLLDVLGALRLPVLGIYGRQDDIAPAADVDAARERLPTARWLVYQDGAHDFLDEDADTFDPVAASDAEKRLVGFFLDALAARPLEAAG